MALPELFANSPVPGSVAPLTTLNGTISTTPAANTQETWVFLTAPPAALAQAGQFRFVVDAEILLDITGGAGVTRTVLRGQEGSTVATHTTGASIFHYLTAAGIAAYVLGLITNAILPRRSVAISTTLVLADSNGAVDLNSASATVLTVPTNASVAFPVNTVIEIGRLGAGSVTITPAAGVTIPNIIEAAGTTSRTIADQFAGAALRKLAADQWMLQGDLA